MAGKEPLNQSGPQSGSLGFCGGGRSPTRPGKGPSGAALGTASRPSRIRILAASTHKPSPVDPQRSADIGGTAGCSYVCLCSAWKWFLWFWVSRQRKAGTKGVSRFHRLSLPSSRSLFPHEDPKPRRSGAGGVPRQRSLTFGETRLQFNVKHAITNHKSNRRQSGSRSCASARRFCPESPASNPTA